MRTKGIFRGGICMVLLLVLAAGLMRPALTAPPVTEAWVRRYHGMTDEHTGARMIKLDNAGNVYISGTSGDGCDLVSYDPSGNQRWVKHISGMAPVSKWSMVVDSARNVYLCGSYADATGVNGGDYITVSYDSNGNQRWARYYNGPDSRQDYAFAVALDSHENICVTGGSMLADFSFDYVTISYDSDGNERWFRRYDGPTHYDDYANAVVADSMGNVYVTGLSYGIGSFLDRATISYDSNGNERWIRRDEAGGARLMVIDGVGNLYISGANLVSYDSNGNQRWLQAQFVPSPEEMAVDSAGNLYLTGGSTGAFGGDFLTASYDLNGVLRWSQTYDGPVNGLDGRFQMGLALDNSGSVYVTGTSEGSLSADYATVSYTSNGVQRWVQRYDGPIHYSDTPTAVAVDGDGSVYVTGSSVRNSSNSDFTTIKYTQALPDTTPPTCVVGSVVTASSTRVYIPLTLSDSGSGVAQVKLTSNSTNCQLEWDGSSGTVTAPIGGTLVISPSESTTQVRAVKLNASQKARVEVQVWDAAGNTALVDPVIASLTIKKPGTRLTRTFRGIPQAERYVTLQNGTPGLGRVTLWVNGKVAYQESLVDGQVVSLDVAQWLRAGGRNVVRVAARGVKGATAVLTIGDVVPSGSAVSRSILGNFEVNQEFAL